MILIVRGENDGAAEFIERRLRERGEDVVRFNPRFYPVQAACSIAYSAGGDRRSRLRIGDTTVDLAEVSAVWYHQSDLPGAHREITDPRARRFVDAECRIVLFDLWHTLDCVWLPGPPITLQRGQYKIAQLKLAAEVGFEIPPTLVTTEPRDVLDFYQAHGGKIVSKMTGVTSAWAIESDAYRYTEPVTPRDLCSVDAIRFCPITFQAYVPKQVELRVVVAGDDVFAAAMHTQGNHRTRIDWRHYDRYRTPYERHDLPPDLRIACLRLVERLGLRYGAIDLILTPDGRYVFLEINPGGQYVWIELATGYPITDAICDLLTSSPSPAIPTAALATTR
jgi:hypothetical protein